MFGRRERGLEEVMTLETPCTRICTLDPRSEHCIGCGRSLQEITQWTRLSADERSRVMQRLPERLARLRRPIPASNERT